MSKVPRGLSNEFLNEFINGMLQPVLKRVRNDDTLDFEIRSEEVHIYYRGGKILGIKPTSKRNDIFDLSFDKKYFLNSEVPLYVKNLPERVSSQEDIIARLEQFPIFKQAMDFYGKKFQKNEREYQQNLIRENNYSTVSNGTDYFIVDMEYNHPNTDIKGRADLTAFRWESKGSNRKKGKVKLCLLEVKYSDKALKGKSGLQEHIEHMIALTKNKDALDITKKEMLNIFRQKRQLGLISFGSKTNENEVSSFSDETPEIILLLINHDPESKSLLEQLQVLSPEDKKYVSIATSNFLGYGLYTESIYSTEEFIAKFGKQIICNGKMG